MIFMGFHNFDYFKYSAWFEYQRITNLAIFRCIYNGSDPFCWSWSLSSLISNFQGGGTGIKNQGNTTVLHVYFQLYLFTSIFFSISRKNVCFSRTWTGCYSKICTDYYYESNLRTEDVWKFTKIIVNAPIEWLIHKQNTYSENPPKPTPTWI